MKIQSICGVALCRKVGNNAVASTLVFNTKPNAGDFLRYQCPVLHLCFCWHFYCQKNNNVCLCSRSFFECRSIHYITCYILFKNVSLYILVGKDAVTPFSPQKLRLCWLPYSIFFFAYPSSLTTYFFFLCVLHPVFQSRKTWPKLK